MGDTESRDEIGQAREVGAIKRALADRLARGALPAPVAAIVHRRLRRDPAWAAWYDLGRRLEREAEGRPALSGAQRALVKQMLFAAPFDEEPAPARSRKLALGGAIAAAAAVVLVVLVARPGADEAAAWQPRSASTSGPVGFRVRCLAPGGERVLAEAEAGSRPAVTPPALACPDDGMLAFSATNLSEETTYFFVVGVNEEGEARWYAPFDASARSATIAPGAVDEVMPSLAGLGPMADDSRVALFAVFSPRPLSAGVVAQAVRRVKDQGLSLPALSRLPLPASLQVRVDLGRGGGG